MNQMDALYAVTRLNWYSLHQHENAEALYLFRVCKGFKFPLLDEQIVVFPQCSGSKLHNSLLTYIFGNIWPSWEEFIPEDWIHYIEATVFALRKKSVCNCCLSLTKYFENILL
jgi:hypothetical protein